VHGWPGLTLVGHDSGFTPEGSALFEVSGSELKITLTPLSATIPASSRLVNPLHPATDVSSEWGFKSNLAAGSGALGPLGSLGVGAMGDINFGADSFGRWITTAAIRAPCMNPGVASWPKSGTRGKRRTYKSGSSPCR
jgi:hypothetical protein